MVLADPREVRIVHGGMVLACHQRGYDQGTQIEDAAHIQALTGRKTRGHTSIAGTIVSPGAAPASQTLLARAAPNAAPSPPR